MNKFSKLLTGAFAIALCACSSEEPIVGGGDNQIPAGPTGDTAYLAIDLCDANSMGRGEDGGFEFDENRTDENYVKNAYFYFYDESGRFVSEANLWTGGNSNNTNDPTGPNYPSDENGNVEFFGNNTVILSGLTGKKFPNYVVTVLNKPSKMADGSAFAPGATLDEMGKIILESYKEGDNFIMTTTSWRGDAVDHADKYYFATKLQEKNFFNELPTKEEITNDRRAEIYVERLAVKVRVKVSDKLTNTKKENVDVKAVIDGAEKTLIKGATIYKLNLTAAGSVNDGKDDNATTPGEGANADTDLWIAFDGWALNSVAKNTKLMKDLSDFGENTTVGGSWSKWNVPALHRSYWGQATTYGLADDALTAAMEDFVEFPDLKNAINTGVAYCNENTNTAANITSANGVIIPAKTTSVHIKAFVCDNNGNALDIVTYNGLTFLKDRFMAYIMQMVGPNYYTRTLLEGVDESEAKPENYDYTQITLGDASKNIPSDVELVSAGLGTGTVKLALTTAAAAKEWYTVERDATGKVTKATLVNASDINSALAAPTVNANHAVAATTGATYYPIAIEHLYDNKENTIVEGEYGVVRNHVYELNISSIKALGNGVFKPGIIEGETPEPLDPKDPKDPKYYVGARINILSWKIVNQNVTLD